MSEIRIPIQLLPKDGRFGCGPSKVRDAQVEFLASLQPSTLGTSHRQAPVKNLVASVLDGAKQLFRAPEGYEMVLANGGATSFWDAAAHSLIRTRSQHCVFGEFSSKFAKVAKSAPFLEEPDIREAAVGSIAVAEPVAGVDVYAYPQNETSTGAMSPVRRVAGDSDALTIVDATSAAGGIDFDANETDVYYFSPQKNFGSDGGIWFALMSPAALERIERVSTTDRYIPETLSLATAVTNSRKNQTLNTPAVSTLALMDEQIRWINTSGGLGWAAQRTAAASQHLYSWAEQCEVTQPFVEDPAERSQVVVTIDFDDRVDAAALAKILRQNGIVDTEPYRKLGRNQLRIGTFTSIDLADVQQLTSAMDYVLERLVN
jgi:phosphoserine aminotransferase